MPSRPVPATAPAPSTAPADAPTAAPAADWLALDRQLCFALYAASLAMTKTYKPLLAPLGLTYPQYLVLLVLWEADGITVSQLGERLTLDSGTLTPLLKRLEAQALLQRQRDAGDERRVRLLLTPAGRALRSRAEAVPRAIACATACDLQQIGSLAAQLHGLRRQLQPGLDTALPHDAAHDAPHTAPNDPPHQTSRPASPPAAPSPDAATMPQPA